MRASAGASSQVASQALSWTRLRSACVWGSEPGAAAATAVLAALKTRSACASSKISNAITHRLPRYRNAPNTK